MKSELKNSLMTEKVKYYLKQEGIKLSSKELKSFVANACEKQEMFDSRIKTAMTGFKATPEMIQKVIAMNDGLYERFRLAYADLKERKARIESNIVSEKINVSGYRTFVAFTFGYDVAEEGIEAATEENILCTLSDYTDYLFPEMESDETEKELPSFEKWAEKHLKLGNLNFPELEGYKIYSYMEDIFLNANTFCIADINYLKSESLQWNVVVEYEHFNFDKKKVKNG